MPKLKILIIDDEPLIVKSTCLALSIYGFEAKGFHDGPSGIAAAAAEQPNLILLDIMMPGMDGWEVLKRLKEESATREIPVVIFTAKEYYNGKTLASSKGAADFIAKP